MLVSFLVVQRQPGVGHVVHQVVAVPPGRHGAAPAAAARTSRQGSGSALLLAPAATEHRGRSEPEGEKEKRQCGARKLGWVMASVVVGCVRVGGGRAATQGKQVGLVGGWLHLSWLPAQKQSFQWGKVPPNPSVRRHARILPTLELPLEAKRGDACGTLKLQLRMS